MRWALAGCLACGVAGCTWIIGDIPVPDDVSVDAEAIAGSWYVYGLVDRRAIAERIEIAADGAVSGDGIASHAAVADDGLWHLELGDAIGRISGRFDPAGGVGLMVESAPGDPAAFVTLIRVPSVRGSLLDGRTLQLGLTDAGSPLAEFARLERSQDEIYGQSERLTLTDDRLDARQATVVAEGEDAPRWVVRLDAGDWLLSPLVSGDGAIGVGRDDAGNPTGPVLLWRDPISAELPARELFCAGLTLEDGRVASRMRQGSIGPERVSWSDGRLGRPGAVDGTPLLEGESSFFDDQGTLLLPDTGSRLFALMPIVPAEIGAAPRRSWGMAMCIGVEGAQPEPEDAGLDADPAPDAGAPDALVEREPDVGSPADAAVDGAPWDGAATPDGAPQ